MADEDRMPEQSELFQTAMAPEPPSPAPEPVAEPPPVAPAAHQEAPAAAVPKEVPPPEPAAIPSWRLREEAEARRVAEDRARALEQRLNEITAHVQQRDKPPDFFENPDKATEAIIMRAIGPYAEENRRQLMHMGKMVATALHGADKVTEAEKAFLEARDNNALDSADYERVVGSPNRYDAVVEWHQRYSVLSSVGTDPKAWLEKQIEAMIDTPEFQAKVMQRAKVSAATKPSVTKLPPSLSKNTAAANSAAEPEGDMSDSSLFAHAMRR
jgi:hypothetical protein